MSHHLDWLINLWVMPFTVFFTLNAIFMLKLRFIFDIFLLLKCHCLPQNNNWCNWSIWMTSKSVMWMTLKSAASVQLTSHGWLESQPCGWFWSQPRQFFIICKQMILKMPWLTSKSSTRLTSKWTTAILSHRQWTNKNSATVYFEVIHSWFQRHLSQFAT